MSKRGKKWQKFDYDEKPDESEENISDEEMCKALMSGIAESLANLGIPEMVIEDEHGNKVASIKQKPNQ